MNLVKTVINGTEYELATTLRVAYEVQGKHNHKSYMAIFSEMGDMTLEEQLDILYVAFKIKNSEIAKTFTAVMFREYYLDNYNVSDIMEQLHGVISGILGKDINTDEDSKAEADEPKNA